MEKGRARVNDPKMAKDLTDMGISVDVVDNIDEEANDGKEYGQPISREEFENLPVGKLVQFRGKSSKIKKNNKVSIELEDGARINHNMFNEFGRIPGGNTNESHTKNSNDKYVVRPCKNKKEPWAVWEGEKRVKGFSTKADAQKYANKQNKSQKLSESSTQKYLVSYQVGSIGASRQEIVTASDEENAKDQIIKKEGGIHNITKGWDGKPVINAKPAATQTSYMVKENDNMKLYALDLRSLTKKYLQEGKSTQEIANITKALINKFDKKGGAAIAGHYILIKN